MISGVDRSKIGFVVGLKAEARLLRGSGFMVGVGGGKPEGAAVAAQALIAGGAAALVSFGLAGGLAPGLMPGAILVPQTVLEGAERFPCDEKLSALLGGSSTEMIYAGAGIAGTARQKAALFAETNADAVDLESGAVARVAAAHKLPFAVLRAVADPASRDLPPAAMTALNAAGRIDVLAVLGSVARRPGQIPLLIVLARDAARARRALLGALRRLEPGA